MKKLITLAAVAGVVAMQACAVDTDTQDEGTVAEDALTAPTISVSSWTGGYTANVTLTNPLPTATSHWTVIIDLNGTTVTSSWNTSFSATSGKVSAKPMSYNTNISPNGTVSFGWQGSSPSNTQPKVVAWNMDTGDYAACDTNSGKMPTMAALAVATGKELGRFYVEKDLTITNGMVALASGAVCTSNSCKNIKAILGQQNSAAQAAYDQSVFNVADFRSTLTASMDRQKNQTANTSGLAALMANHKLTAVQGPVNLKLADQCGPHYVFQVDYKSTGLPLSSTDAAKLANALCLFNAAGCGGNKFIGYVSSGLSGCPSGKTCIAIDPTDGDNSTTVSTNAGSAVTYPLNRVYDPSNTLVAKQCITTAGLLGTLVSKCGAIPSTCGYLYCIKN